MRWLCCKASYILCALDFADTTAQQLFSLGPNFAMLSEAREGSCLPR